MQHKMVGARRGSLLLFGILAGQWDAYITFIGSVVFETTPDGQHHGTNARYRTGIN